jgi:sulfur carrier protein ThiS
MRVQIRRFAMLRQYGPPGEDPTALDVPQGTSAADLLARMGIPTGVDTVILVNGRHAVGQTPLAEGDVVTLFPPVEGG